MHRNVANGLSLSHSAMHANFSKDGETQQRLTLFGPVCLAKRFVHMTPSSLNSR